MGEKRGSLFDRSALVVAGAVGWGAGEGRDGGVEVEAALPAQHHVKSSFNLMRLSALCCKCLIHAILSQSSEPLLQRAELQISATNDLIYSQK